MKKETPPSGTRYYTLDVTNPSVEKRKKLSKMYSDQKLAEYPDASRFSN